MISCTLAVTGVLSVLHVAGIQHVVVYGVRLDIRDGQVIGLRHGAGVARTDNFDLSIPRHPRINVKVTRIRIVVNVMLNHSTVSSIAGTRRVVPRRSLCI